MSLPLAKEIYEIPPEITPSYYKKGRLPLSRDIMEGDKEDASWYESAGVSAVKGGPAALTAWGGAELGAAVGSVAGPIGTITGGVLGAIGGGLLGHTLTEKAIETYDPALAKDLQDIQAANPTWSTVGSVASFAPLTGVSRKGLDIVAKQFGTTPVKAGVVAAGAGTALDIGIQATGDTPIDIASGLVVGASTPFMLGSTGLGKGISGIVEKATSKVKGSKLPLSEDVLTPKSEVEAPPQKTLVDTTVEQWQKELGVEAPKQPLEASVTGEGVPTPTDTPPIEGRPLREAPTALADEALGKLDFLNNPPKEYHPKDAIEIRNWADKELRNTVPDQDGRTELRMLKQKADEVLSGDMHPSVVKETGLDIRRNGNYIDVVEVPENLQKQGLGTKIVENLETDMRAEGHKSAFLLAKEESIPFWEKQGYQIDPTHVREKGENVPMSKVLREPLPITPEVTAKVTEGIIIEADGTPAVTAKGKPRIARRNKETGDIEINPEAAKESWETSTPENIPWVRETFDSPERYKEFLILHEKEHGITLQKKGESELDYEKRVTNIALEKMGIKREVKLPSIYDVVNEADFHLKGKQVLREQGPEAAHQFADNYIKERGTDLLSLQASKDILHEKERFIHMWTRKADVFGRQIEAALPDIKMRDQVTRALEGELKRDTLPKNHPGVPILKRIQERYAAAGDLAKQVGLFKETLENYVSHVLDFSKTKMTPEQQKLFTEKIFGEINVSKLNRDFSIHRQYTFLRDLEARLRESQVPGLGQVTVLTDIARIMPIYEKSIYSAIAFKEMRDKLSKGLSPNGKAWFVPNTPEAIKAGYVEFKGKGSSHLEGLVVHKELIGQMTHLMNISDPAMLVRAMGALSHIIKITNTMASLFHAKAIFEGAALLSPSSTLKEISTGFAGVKAAKKAIIEGGEGINIKIGEKDFNMEDMIERLMLKGLKLTTKDINRSQFADTGILLDRGLNKLIPGDAKVKVAQRVTEPFDNYILKPHNTFTWDYVHAGGKLIMAVRLFAGMKIKNPEIPDDQLLEAAATAVNRTFGGIEWAKEAARITNKFVSAIAMRASGVKGLQWAHIMVFAPDWTASGLLSVSGALPKQVTKPYKWKLKEGVKGLINPKTHEDLARKYVINTAIMWFTLLNGINLAVSGRPIWENEDPTRLEFPDGTSVQVAKQSMEPAHWGLDPVGTGVFKLGFFPQAAYIQATGKQYPYKPFAGEGEKQAPDVKPVYGSVQLGKALTIASRALPFPVQAAKSAPEGEGLIRGGAAVAGFSIYGHTKEQLAQKIKKGKQEAKERKLKRMLEGD